MKKRHGTNRAGFTIIELLIVTVVIGILAGIAIPSFQRVVWKARAAEVVSDIHTITLAYHEFLADGGGRLNNVRWGTVPAALSPYLPEGFSFSTEVVDYRWTRVRPNQSPWDVEMGLVRVRPIAQYRKLMMPPLRAAAPTATSVSTNNQVRFYITP
jgi:prepilin-type N-terminal cleavage/methylation domain-containing protein